MPQGAKKERRVGACVAQEEKKIKEIRGSRELEREQSFRDCKNGPGDPICDSKLIRD